MLKSHDRFYSSTGKRAVLVVDDEMINRELLGAMLEEDFNVLSAEDGREALAILREKKDLISLVLLDLMMPVVSGFDVIREMKEDEVLQNIPIIVLTADKSAEVESLRMGANDFIPKPYDLPEVIVARVKRSIELAEDRSILSNTERDKLTGVLNREFFYNYAAVYDLHHPDTEMDAVSVDIYNFHMINELNGWAYGDETLRYIGDRLLEFAVETDSIVGRLDADVFMVYCPHGTDPVNLLNACMKDIGRFSALSTQFHLRVGVYQRVDKNISMKSRFDRAKHAAITIRNNYAQNIAVYDDAMHDREILEAQLIDELDKALAERQFTVYYQPKYNIRGEKPVLASAEALIRWNHPRRGVISPGVFIPIFEGNGLIQKVDRYVWREVARQVRQWQDKFGIRFPVSVNVSRYDINTPDFMQTILGLVREFDIDPYQYMLEITESAYTEDSDKLIETVETLRRHGFRIEMDDFGSGYSSLNTLTQLPIDALKLDMKFIRGMGASKKNDKILKLIIEIAEFLSVPVIAEGVEKEEQLRTLKELGCDLIQGYYFSRPVPPQEFEKFFEEGEVKC